MNKKYIISSLIFLTIIIVAYIVLSSITQNKINSLKHQKFLTTSKNMQQQFNTLVTEKKKTTLAIGLLLSKNNSYKKALLDKNISTPDLKEYSKILREHSDFKNIWFHLINGHGVSISRSWIKKSNDSVLDARMDVIEILKTKKIMTTISVGKFDFTFKALIPVFNQNHLIGIFETITHFNSIAQTLMKKNIYSVILVDKKYKKQLIKPFTNMFINDYYIANKNARKKQIDIIKKKQVEFFINYPKNYYIDNYSKQLITIVKIPDKQTNPMGYAILFKPLDSIDMSKIAQIKTNMILYNAILLIVLITIIFYIIATKKYYAHLKRTELILETQPNITILTNGNNIIDANNQLLNFFNKYNDLKSFVKEHKCICDFFEKINDSEYINDEFIDKERWIEYVLNHKNKTIKVAMKKDGILHHFIVKVSQSKFKKRFIVIVLLDITNEVKIRQELAKKEKIVLEQSRMAAIGEMIGNIAHQWRQPLNAISTNIISIRMKQALHSLSDEQLINSCNFINDNVQYLSKTIDDFRNFIKGDRTKKVFNLKNNIDDFLHLVDSSIENNNITIVLDLNADITIDGYENELIQCFINIFNNSKDALKEREIKEKLIFITTTTDNNKAIIKFKDNANGIAKNVLPKIFDPYFTTKHQSQGTGLGLNMTYNLIVEGMDGTIKAKNETFKYNGIEYTGVSFVITIPLS